MQVVEDTTIKHCLFSSFLRVFTERVDQSRPASAGRQGAYCPGESELYLCLHAVFHLVMPLQVLVLLLCSAVDHEPNEEVIDKIFSLDNEVQHHIKFFIEHALSEVNSDAIATGRFTSGESTTARVVCELYQSRTVLVLN